MGFGQARLQAEYIPIRWPNGLWYRRFTQNNDLHLFVYDDRIALRVHIDAFHGDRARNNQALDIVRAEVAGGLQERLPRHDAIDWRAARGGNNKVCAIYRLGGVAAHDAASDASWVVDPARAWLHALIEHPLPDLIARVQHDPAGT
jgi:hypothetical protein